MTEDDSRDWTLFERLAPWSKAQEKNGLELKDAISLLMALAALVISFVTLYYTTIRQVDDLGVIIRGPAHVTIDQSTAEFKVEQLKKDALTFVNLGNRSAAINSIKMFAIQPDDKGELRECGEPNSEFEPEPETLNVEAIVVKAGEIGCHQV
jgi:hypothetical protein